MPCISIEVLFFRLDVNIHGDAIMKKLIVSVLLAITLLMSGMVVTQYNMVGTAYADSGGDC